MKTVTRRSALELLGLGTAMSSAVAVEALGQVAKPGMAGFKFGSNTNPQTVASALERLAASIRRQESIVMTSSLLTTIAPDEYLTHRLSIDFVLPDDVATS